MKNILSCLLYILSSFTIFGQAKFDVTINFEGVDREFIVSVPTTPPPANGYPLVMMLHGTSGDKNVFYDAPGWKELGQSENFVTVFPSSLKWCYDDEGITKKNTKFVCGDLIDKICPSDTSKLVNDVHFLRKVIELVSDTININQEKVFGCGFSNGCVMSYKNAMESGDVFKAVGGVAGIYHQLDSITPDVRVPFWVMIGNKDDRFIVPPFTELPFGGDSILGYLNVTITRTLASMGLKNTFTKNENLLTKTYIFKECEPGIQCAPYILTLIKGMPHQFPNGTNFPIDAPKLFWQFFNNPPEVITATKTESDANPVLKCFPNPSSETITLSFSDKEQEKKVKIYNSFGVLIKYIETNEPGLNLTKEEFGPGIYFVEVKTAFKKITDKFIFQ